jgi:hypothetical protein
MELVFAERFERSLRQGPAPVQRAFWKQVGFLLSNLNHPSLTVMDNLIYRHEIRRSHHAGDDEMVVARRSRVHRSERYG